MLTHVIDIDTIDKTLIEWFDSKQAINVKFARDIHPCIDDQDDYEIVYEACFESNQLDKAAVEVWVTSDGYIAIGFERWGRIAGRLGAKSNKKRFAAGHEPIEMAEQELISLLDIIAGGNIAISAITLPVIGLFSLSVFICNDTVKANNLEGYSSRSKWLNNVSQNKFTRCQLQFSCWDQDS